MKFWHHSPKLARVPGLIHRIPAEFLLASSRESRLASRSYCSLSISYSLPSGGVPNLSLAPSRHRASPSATYPATATPSEACLTSTSLIASKGNSRRETLISYLRTTGSPRVDAVPSTPPLAVFQASHEPRTSKADPNDARTSSAFRAHVVFLLYQRSRRGQESLESFHS